MPKSRVVIYREEDGSSPFVDWFTDLPMHARDKVLVRIERLRELGHEFASTQGGFFARQNPGASRQRETA